MVGGRGQVAPLVAHLGQPDVRHADGRWRPGAPGHLQSSLVGALRSAQPPLGLLNPPEVEGRTERQVPPFRRGPFGEEVGQHAFRGDQAPGDPVRERHVVAGDRAEQLVVLGQLLEGGLGELTLPFCFSVQAGQIGAGDRDGGRHVGQEAVVAVDRGPVRLAGRLVERLLRHRQQRFDLVQPAGHHRDLGLPQREHRPALDHLGRERGEPGDEGRDLGAPPDLLLEVPLDQLGGPGHLAGDQRMPDGVGRQLVPLVPARCGAVQLRHPRRVPPLQGGAQQVGEQVVVAPPATLLVERDQEQVGPLHRLQPAAGCSCTPPPHRRASRTAAPGPRSPAGTSAAPRVGAPAPPGSGSPARTGGCRRTPRRSR